MFTFHFSNIVKDKDRQIVSFVENYFVSSNKNLDLNVVLKSCTSLVDWVSKYFNAVSSGLQQRDVTNEINNLLQISHYH